MAQRLHIHVDGLSPMLRLAGNGVLGKLAGFNPNSFWLALIWDRSTPSAFDAERETGSRLDLESSICDLRDAPRYSHPMQLVERKRFQDQQIQGSLEKIRLRGGHAVSYRLSIRQYHVSYRRSIGPPERRSPHPPAPISSLPNNMRSRHPSSRRAASYNRSGTQSTKRTTRYVCSQPDRKRRQRPAQYRTSHRRR